MAKAKKKSSPTKSKPDDMKIEFMGAPSHTITPFLMFNADLVEVTNFYVSIFKKSKIIRANRMQADFILNGQKFSAYNGGPNFQFSWGVSFMISVDTQKEVDYYWNALLVDGGKESMCGWVQDKYGMWWQVTPNILLKLISHKDSQKAERARRAMLKMRKIDIAALKAAAG
ncbi:3-demethylubiquinone-9 3-methyltransferase domain protein [Leptospira fainei serovar Hurstbridge str. BUT 6]|uniref:3-demethylubiquinone-9 3-methyltransferase domain protein n=1 Tax=Leptospira fainei serovar Hurstbridge str. BUT 6 TaxID=1193011 RepID=S3UW83_9LEPT|nr:VOC family protein [Leptospira fainei]EPG72599.1 3-demethylubiquinone-9 3-methyltransferase domain protein [Leptospira fainei serovar Hurstbridge str. BUT 6]